MTHSTLPDPDPRPSNPPILLALLIGARRSGDRTTERLARDWLAAAGRRGGRPPSV